MEKTAGKRLDEMTDKISEVASEIGEKFETGAEETKKVASGVKKWRKNASAEEITTTIIGIILLIFALWALRAFIWGVLLLLVGVLCVSGYFNPFLKKLFEKVQSSEEKTEEKVEKKIEKAEKVVEKKKAEVKKTIKKDK